MRDFASAPPPPPSPAPPVPRRLAVPDLPNAPPAAPFSFDSPTESLIASRSGELSFPRPAARRFLLSSVARRPPFCACCPMALNLRDNPGPLTKCASSRVLRASRRTGNRRNPPPAFQVIGTTGDLMTLGRVRGSADVPTKRAYDGGSDCFHPALSCSDNFFTTAA